MKVEVDEVVEWDWLGDRKRRRKKSMGQKGVRESVAIFWAGQGGGSVLCYAGVGFFFPQLIIKLVGPIKK